MRVLNIMYLGVFRFQYELYDTVNFNNQIERSKDLDEIFYVLMREDISTYNEWLNYVLAKKNSGFISIEFKD